MDIETKVKQVLQKVLDVPAEKISAQKSLEAAFGVDSTEMVEINVGIKKALGINLANNDLKKTHSLAQILEIVSAKADAGSCGPACGCGH